MKKKLIIDILLFILMLLEFSRNYIVSILHEIIGISLLILVIIHLILNKNYLINIFKTKYNLKKIIILVINILFMISFIITMLFGILSSIDLLPFLNLDNFNIIHLHKVFGYISLLMMGLHLGINFNVIFGKLVSKIKNKYLLYGLSILIIILGIYSFIKVDFWYHLIGRYGFSIVTDNIFINTLEYLSVGMTFAIITNLIYRKGMKK